MTMYLYTTSAVILEADGREYSRSFPQTVPPSPSAVSLGKADPLPAAPVPPLYGPPLSSCTPFESILGQEV